MLINAELLLQFQRCQRRPYLDVRHDRNHRDIPSDLAIKLRNDKIARQKQVLAQWKYSRPKSHRQDPKNRINSALTMSGASS